jgi:hypothetical protein
MSDILEKLKLLFEEYKKSLNEFGVRPAPLPADLGIYEFMECMETEFKALSEVISGASDFATAFSVESILKILHDFDCADLEKFREKNLSISRRHEYLDNSGERRCSGYQEQICEGILASQRERSC